MFKPAELRNKCGNEFQSVAAGLITVSDLMESWFKGDSFESLGGNVLDYSKVRAEYSQVFESAGKEQFVSECKSRRIIMLQD